MPAGAAAPRVRALPATCLAGDVCCFALKHTSDPAIRRLWQCRGQAPSAALTASDANTDQLIDLAAGMTATGTVKRMHTLVGALVGSDTFFSKKKNVEGFGVRTDSG
jgi:hypothetical protein